MFESQIVQLKAIVRTEMEKAGYGISKLITDSITKRILKSKVWTYVSAVEFFDDPGNTAFVDLRSGKVRLEIGFFDKYLNSIEDVLYLIIHERNHLILNYCYHSDIWSANCEAGHEFEGFVEDAFINPMVNRVVKSDLPTRYYIKNKSSQKLHTVLLTSDSRSVRKMYGPEIADLHRMLWHSPTDKVPDFGKEWLPAMLIWLGQESKEREKEQKEKDKQESKQSKQESKTPAPGMSGSDDNDDDNDEAQESDDDSSSGSGKGEQEKEDKPSKSEGKGKKKDPQGNDDDETDESEDESEDSSSDSDSDTGKDDNDNDNDDDDEDDLGTQLIKGNDDDDLSNDLEETAQELLDKFVDLVQKAVQQQQQEQPEPNIQNDLMISTGYGSGRNRPRPILIEALQPKSELMKAISTLDNDEKKVLRDRAAVQSEAGLNLAGIDKAMDWFSSSMKQNENGIGASSPIIPSHISKRDVMSIAQGQIPVIWQGKFASPNKKAKLYMDVSGSMESYLGLIPYIYGRMIEHVDEIFEFSTWVVRVAPEDKFYYSTGGTDFDPVAEHIIDQGIDSIIVISDGEATMSEARFEKLAQQVQQMIYIIFKGSYDEDDPDRYEDPWKNLAERVGGKVVSGIWSGPKTLVE